MKRLFLAAFACLVLLNPQSEVKAQITWQTSVPIYDAAALEAFVDTTGNTAVAMNVVTNGQAGAADPNPVAVTVNGVLFTPSGNGSLLAGPGGESIECNSSTFVDPVTGLLAAGIGANGGAFRAGEFDATTHPNLSNLVRGAAFRIQSITLGGLTIGDDYLIQAIVQDGRNSRDTNWLTGFGDGSGSTAPVGTAKLSNQVPGADPPAEINGDSIIGTFTADSETLTFKLFGAQDGVPTWTGDGLSGRAQMNAIQLRNVSGGSVLLGDCDMNGVINFLDISPFISILSGTTFVAQADCNEDGMISFLDISPFIAILSGS